MRGNEYGEHGVREYRAGAWPAGTVTDDTQMTLFTMAGLIRGGIRRDRGLGLTVAVVHRAYDDWLDTQQLSGPRKQRTWLRSHEWLYAQRVPGNTCLQALRDARDGRSRIPQYGGQAANNSKGCGGVMRVAPFGLMPPDGAPEAWYFDSAAEAAGYTHSHPTGQLAAGALGSIVHHLVAGAEPPAAIGDTQLLLSERDGHEETSTALRKATELAASGEPSIAAVESLGGGWVAEEALAIAVYAALVRPAPDQVLDALAVAVTHSGDSDSTGAVCGNILGAWHGATALPPELVFTVQGRGTILELADDFVLEFTQSARLHGDDGPDTGWTDRFGAG